MPTVGVFAMIFNENGEVLCVQRNYPPYGWTTPGGRLEEHEAPEDGVVREVLEETGFRVAVERLLGVYAAPFKSDLVIAFVCKTLGRDKWCPDAEISDVRFFPIDQLPTPMKRNTAIRIRDAASGQNGIWRTFSPEEHA